VFCDIDFVRCTLSTSGNGDEKGEGEDGGTYSLKGSWNTQPSECLKFKMSYIDDGQLGGRAVSSTWFGFNSNEGL
jgi:hypothetical protein